MPRLAQGQVLKYLLGHGLRQLLQEALGNGALDDLARDALDGGLRHQRVRCGARGGRGGIVGELARHASRALRQHGFCIADAQAVRQPAAQRAERAADQAGGTSQAGLLCGQQAIIGFLSDLLGRRASHDGALACRAGQRCGAGHGLLGGFGCGCFAQAGARCGAASHGATRCQHTTRGDTAQTHDRQRLAHGGSDQTRVLDRGLGLVPQAVSLLELALCVLGGVGVPFIDGFLGLLRPETEGAALVLQKLADPAAGGDVGQANGCFRHSDGALDGRGRNVARPAAEATVLRRRILQQFVRFGARRGGHGLWFLRRVRVVFGRAIKESVDFAHCPTFAAGRRTSKPYARRIRRSPAPAAAPCVHRASGWCR